MSVVVVGGGVLGFMHALEARRRGHPVTHLEREPGSRGASVRNFGLIWVSGRAGGPELDLARRARVRWAEIAAEVPGTGFRPNGSLTLARDDAELELLKEAAARPDADLRDYELLDPAAVRVVNPALRGEFAGGLFCRADAAVEPRLVPAALRASLLGGTSAQAPYQWLPGREAVELASHAVRDHTGAWHRADLVVLCPGAAHTGIAGPHLAAFAPPPVRRVRLQMMQTPPGRRTDYLDRGRRLAALLPRLRPARPPAAGLAGRGSRPGQRPVAAGAAAGWQPHDRGHARVRPAVRVRCRGGCL
jgi:glycine/D-amino acid oxidase-like deaminating enzyme